MYLAYVSQDTLPQEFRQVWPTPRPGRTPCSQLSQWWPYAANTAQHAARPVALAAVDPANAPNAGPPPPPHPNPTLAQALAVDISLAALLGEDVYNFGELLLHPIVSPAPPQAGLKGRTAPLRAALPALHKHDPTRCLAAHPLLRRSTHSRTTALAGCTKCWSALTQVRDRHNGAGM